MSELKCRWSMQVLAALASEHCTGRCEQPGGRDVTASGHGTPCARHADARARFASSSTLGARDFSAVRPWVAASRGDERRLPL